MWCARRPHYGSQRNREKLGSMRSGLGTLFAVTSLMVTGVSSLADTRGEAVLRRALSALKSVKSLQAEVSVPHGHGTLHLMPPHALRWVVEVKAEDKTTKTTVVQNGSRLNTLVQPPNVYPVRVSLAPLLRVTPTPPYVNVSALGAGDPPFALYVTVIVFPLQIAYRVLFPEIVNVAPGLYAVPVSVAEVFQRENV